MLDVGVFVFNGELTVISNLLLVLLLFGLLLLNVLEFNVF